MFFVLSFFLVSSLVVSTFNRVRFLCVRHSFFFFFFRSFSRKEPRRFHRSSPLLLPITEEGASCCTSPVIARFEVCNSQIDFCSGTARPCVTYRFLLWNRFLFFNRAPFFSALSWNCPPTAVPNGAPFTRLGALVGGYPAPIARFRFSTTRDEAPLFSFSREGRALHECAPPVEPDYCLTPVLVG